MTKLAEKLVKSWKLITERYKISLLNDKCLIKITVEVVKKYKRKLIKSWFILKNITRAKMNKYIKKKIKNI